MWYILAISRERKINLCLNYVRQMIDAWKCPSREKNDPHLKQVKELHVSMTLYPLSFLLSDSRDASILKILLDKFLQPALPLEQLSCLGFCCGKL